MTPVVRCSVLLLLVVTAAPCTYKPQKLQARLTPVIRLYLTVPRLQLEQFSVPVVAMIF